MKRRRIQKKQLITPAERNRIEDFSLKKHTEKLANCQNIYEIILVCQEATTAQIEEILEKRNQPLSRRTIERCIAEDDRIIKNKRYYSIDHWARLETRYLNPLRFAYQLWSDVLLPRRYSNDVMGMRNMMEAFGAILMFVFIEASRPFQDKLKGVGKRMDYKDRNDLVSHWALNSIPFNYMLSTFMSVFNYQLQDGKPSPGIMKPTGEPRDEMSDKEIQNYLVMLEKNYPDLYKDLVTAKKRFYENSLKLEKTEYSTNS
jgi:hypothetical protein